MRLNQTLLSKLRTRYSEKTIIAMDAAIKHLKKHKKIYRALIVMIVIGYIDDMFFLLEAYAKDVANCLLGKSISQCTTNEIITIMHIAGKNLLKSIQTICIMILTTITTFNFIKPNLKESIIKLGGKLWN